MTPLRNKMIRELELHRKAPGTIKQYVAAVAELARYYWRSPDLISIEEVRDFIHFLITQRKVAFSTCNVRLAGIRFFYQQVLRQDEFPLRVPMKRSGRLPEPFSRGEIARLLDATRNTKHRTLLMTTYGGVALAVEALKRGASDFVLKPWRNDRLVAAVVAACEKTRAARAAAATFNLELAEKAEIERALAHHGRNVSRAAAALGMTRQALYRRMAKHGL